MPACKPEDLVIYDCEIKYGWPPRSPAVPEADLRYCKSPEDFAGMQISVACAFQMRERRWRVFLDDNLYQLLALVQEGRMLVGFNNRGFDDPLLAANDIVVPPANSWDFLAALRVACGEPPVYTRGRTKAGRSLDAVCHANLGPDAGKQGVGGAQAPAAWQRGQHGSVIDYCLYDVALLVGLIRRATPNCVDPVSGAVKRLVCPWITD